MKPTLIIFGSMSVGLILEGFRLSSGSLKKFLKAILMGLLLSLAVFLPAKKELGYHHDLRLEIWPISFFCGLVIGIVTYFRNQLRPQLSEGITLVSTISFLYFLSEIFRIMNHPSLLWLVIPQSLFTFTSAFTSIDLNRYVRLVLSLWNTFISVVFGIFMIFFIVHEAGDVGSVLTSSHRWDLFFFCLQYAMLGAASLSILYNLYLLFGFMPNKHQALDRTYFKAVKKLTDEHVGRYSSVQIKPFRALLIVLLHAGPLVANYLFHFAAPIFMFWYSLSISPLVVKFVLLLASGNQDRKKTLTSSVGF